VFELSVCKLIQQSALWDVCSISIYSHDFSQLCTVVD